MGSPFFRNHRWYQQPDPISFHPASVRGVPVYPVDPTHRPAHAVHRPQERRLGPKVVRIPVHFVGSEPADRTGSAVKIQKVFRGFFVRKCLKKVKDVGVQVDEIEKKISRREVVELLRRDERERIRMNEALMSLLFKLDSICGVDFGVRGCRKAVTRKAIALQERIDAIVAADIEGNFEKDYPVTEIGVSVNTDYSDHPSGPSEESGVLEDCGESLVNQLTAIGVSLETDNSNNPNHTPGSENSGELEDCGENLENHSADIGFSVETDNSTNPDHPSRSPEKYGVVEDCVENLENVCCGKGNDDGEAGIIDVGVDWEVKVGESTGENLDSEGVRKGWSEGDVKDKNDSEVNAEKGMDGNRRNRELLERMVEESEKVTKMMSELYERNEMQTKMLNSLTQRVEMLEKAFLCLSHRKKKKNNKFRSTTV